MNAFTAYILGRPADDGWMDDDGKLLGSINAREMATTTALHHIAVSPITPDVDQSVHSIPFHGTGPYCTVHTRLLPNLAWPQVVVVGGVVPCIILAKFACEITTKWQLQF